MAALVAALCATAAVRAQSDWPPEFAGLLGAYRSGDYLHVQRTTAKLMSAAGDPRLRREAEALYALTLLRGEVRRDREQGRALMRGIAADDPAVTARPECLMALGIAAAGLNETAEALDELDSAAEGFLAARELDRAAAALRELAGVWSRHSEWANTPARFNVGTPAGEAQIAPTRAAQVDRVRTRLEALPDSPARNAALVGVDTSLARLLLDDPAQEERAVALLASAVASAASDADWAAAARVLAEQLEKRQRWNEALPVYRQLAERGQGDARDRARRKVDEIARPAATMDAPLVTPAGAAIAVKLAVRNAPQARFELRRADLLKFLDENRGALLDARLPDSGELAAEGRLDTPAAVEHGWWRDDAFAIPAQAPGAYVLLVQPMGGADVRPAKKLIIVSELAAAVFVGTRRGVVWAVGADGRPPGDATAYFWMHGSFAPTKVALRDGVGEFALPPESRVLRDKRWTCVVQTGDQVALCRGALAARAAEKNPSPASVALLLSDLEPVAGEVIFIAGMLFEQESAAAGGLPARIELDVIGADDELVWSREIQTTAGGAFRAMVPITPPMSSRTFRVVARGGGGVLPNVQRQTTFAVRDAFAERGMLKIRVPRWMASSDAALRGEIVCEYPWGTAYGDASLVLQVHGMQLPDAASEYSAPIEPMLRTFTVREDGRVRFDIPRAALGSRGEVAGLAFDAELRRFDRHVDSAQARTLISPVPVQVVVSCDAVAPAGAARPVRVRVIDPLQRASSAPPALEVRHAGSVRPLSLTARDGGFECEAWRPSNAGAYELVASQMLGDGTPAVGRRALKINERLSDGVAGSVPRCRARLRGEGGARHVDVEVHGADVRPHLLLLDDGEPRAAAVVSLADGAASAKLPAQALNPASAQVIVAAMSRDGLAARTSADLTADDADSAIVLDAPASVDPGQSVRVAVTIAGGAETDVIMRLRDTSENAIDDWWSAFSGEAPTPGAGTSLRVGVFDGAEADNPGDSPRWLSQGAAAALLAGRNVWLWQGTTRDGRLDVDVPIPDRAERFELIAAARMPHGRLATRRAAMDASGGVRVAFDAPSQFEIGDRTHAVLTIENFGAEALQADLAFDLGAGLAATDAIPGAVRVDPGQISRVRVPIEASAAGIGTSAAVVTSGTREWSRKTEYLVAPGTAEVRGAALGWLAPGRAEWPGEADAPAARTTLHLQAGPADIVLDTAIEWLETQVEGTAAQILQLRWAAAMLRLDPAAADQPLGALLGPLPLGPVGLARLRVFADGTLREFYESSARRLAASRGRDGGWGRWDESSVDAEMTGWALAALADVAQELQPPIDLRTSFGWFDRNAGVESAANAGDSGLWRWGLAALIGLRGDPQPPSTGATVREALAARFKSGAAAPTSAERALYSYYLATGGESRAAQTAEQALHADAAAPAARTRILARLALLETVSADRMDETLSALLSLRSGAGWGDPLLTALAIDGIARGAPGRDIEAAQGEIRAMSNAPIAVGGPDWPVRRILAVESRADVPIEFNGRGRISAARLGAPTPAFDSTVTIRRTLFRLAQRLTAEGKEEWTRHNLPPGETVSPGQIVVVRDEIEPGPALANVEWVQPMPGGLRYWKPKTDTEQAGRLYERNEYCLVYTARRLEPPKKHEFRMMATRPGSFAVPPPIVTADGVRVRVIVSPERRIVGVHE